MKIISEEQKELIDSITAEGLAGNLSAFILEKDVHVTDALHALATLSQAPALAPLSAKRLSAVPLTDFDIITV